MRWILSFVVAVSLLGSAPARAGGEVPLAEIVESRVGRFLLSETVEGRRILRFFTGRTSFAAVDRDLFLARLEDRGVAEFRDELEFRLNRTLRRYEIETFRDPMEMRRLPIAEQRRFMTIAYRTLMTSRSFALGTEGRYVTIRFLEEIRGGERTSYTVTVEEFLGR